MWPPHIDHLAWKGVRLPDAHAPESSGTPTRYGLLIGRYPLRDSMNAWDERTLIEPGYATAMVGKWRLDFDGGTDFDCSAPLEEGTDHGFDDFFGLHASLDIPLHFCIWGDECVAAPHTPWLPLDPYWGPSGVGPYGDFVVHVDAAVGQVLAALGRLGMANNTLVACFVSDNGPVSQDEARSGHHATAIRQGP